MDGLVLLKGRRSSVMVVERKREEECDVKKKGKMVRIELKRRAFERLLMKQTREEELLSTFSKRGNVKLLSLSKSL